MSTGIILKPPAAEHLEGISRVICDAIKRVNAQDYPPAEIDRLLQNFSPANVRALLKNRHTLVALAGGTVVGTGALQGAELKSVFVSPDWHRKGTGTALVNDLERVAESLGTGMVKVSYSLSATDFYAALGYVEKSRSFFGSEKTVLMEKATSRATLR